MPEADEEPPLHGSRLDIKLSRPFFAFTGKNGLVLASLMFVIAAAGWPVLAWLFGKLFIVMSLVWAAALLAFVIPTMLEGYAHRRWARHGPDLWLRISPKGIEFAQLVFRPRQLNIPWPAVRKWWMDELSAKRRIVWIATAKGKRLAINPMDYIWTGYRAPADAPLAVALERDIEALLKLYAGDRQGRTVTAGGKYRLRSKR